MEIIGITGPIGHGKTTFAEALALQEPVSIHLESSQIITEVSDAFHEVMPVPPEQNDIAWMNKWLSKLPPILKDIVHVDCSFEQLSFTEEDVHEDPVEYIKLFKHSVNLVQDPSLAHTKITPENKDLFRPILQWLGGYLVQKVSPGIWYDEIVARSKQAEYEGVKLCIVGGLRFPSDAEILRNAGATITEIYRASAHIGRDATDPTERERQQIKVDAKIYNNGTIDDLNNVASTLLKDIHNHSLKAAYIARQ